MKQINIGSDSLRHALLWIGLPLLVGLMFASSITRPVVGVIRLDDAIHAYSARSMIAQIEYAIEHPEIRAVVLALDSPGGTVVDTEAIYMELTRLREKKPVVTAVNGMSASGAYYLSANTDYIYAKPTSLVGNVGVIGYLPSTPFIFEDIISTGPYKLWGAPRDSDMRQIEMIKQGFYEAVILGRGERLRIGPETLLRGQIWIGTEALHIGVIDELGTETDAANKAADIANVAHFDVIDLGTMVDLPPSSTEFFIQSPQGIRLPYPNKAGIYMLYIPPLPVQE